ncbi:hypothetical protein HanIR_Chr01g0033821 [Helianthus annuus]|nr:hypothetical protein HanIR_Chr01g0033821 [Helianthus annuus]
MKKKKTFRGDDVIGDVTWFTRISGCNSPRVFSCFVSLSNLKLLVLKMSENG